MDIASSHRVAAYLIDLRGSAGLAPGTGGHVMEAVLLYEEHQHIISAGSSQQAVQVIQGVVKATDAIEFNCVPRTFVWRWMRVSQPNRSRR
jgi:hypothetical protein